MKRRMQLLLALLLSGCALIACGGMAPDDASDELVALEQLEQPLLIAQCGATNPQFGVDMANWGGIVANRCDRNNSGMSCHFSRYYYNYAMGIYNANLNSGWTASQRSALVSPAIATASFMNSTWTIKSNGVVGAPTPFYFKTDAASDAYLKINNGSLPGTLNSAFSSVDFRDVFEIVCMSSDPLPENYAATTRLCNRWSGTFDYVKFDNYLTARGLTGNQKVIPLTNVLRKMVIISSGYGMASDGGSDMITDYDIKTTAYQTTFPGGSDTWLSNYHTDYQNESEPSRTLTCVP